MRTMIGLLALSVFGCAHTPTKPGERADLTDEAQQTLQRMVASDPTLRPMLDRAAGYVVFPAVGEGGFIVGGGAGSGVVFENGQRTGFATLYNASVGALAGGQRFAELIIVRDPQTLEQLKAGKYDFGAKASAVILRSGASANANFSGGVAVFIEPLRGAMVNASVGGQRIRITM